MRRIIGNAEAEYCKQVMVVSHMNKSRHRLLNLKIISKMIVSCHRLPSHVMYGEFMTHSYTEFVTNSYTNIAQVVTEYQVMSCMNGACHTNITPALHMRLHRCMEKVEYDSAPKYTL